MTNQQKRELALEVISFSRMKVWKSGRKAFEDRYFLKKKPALESFRLGKRYDSITRGIEVENMNDGERKIFEEKKKTALRYSRERRYERTIRFKGQDYLCVGNCDYEHIATGDNKEQKTSKNIKENLHKNRTDAQRQLEFYAFLRNEDPPRLRGDIEIALKECRMKLKEGLWVEEWYISGEIEPSEHNWSIRAIDRCERRVKQFIREVHLAYPAD